MAAERAERCTRCGRYTRAEGSELCLPCLSAEVVPSGAAPRSCAECVAGYFEGMDREPPARRYRDPMCPRATPWCPLYEGILERIRWAGEVGLARHLDGMRRVMKQQRERRA